MSLKVSCRGTLWALLLGMLFLHSTQGASAPMDSVDAEETADGALDASLEMDLNMEEEIKDTGRKGGGGELAKNLKTDPEHATKAAEQKAEREFAAAKQAWQSDKGTTAAATANAKEKEKAWRTAAGKGKRNRNASLAVRTKEWMAARARARARAKATKASENTAKRRLANATRVLASAMEKASSARAEATQVNATKAAKQSAGKKWAEAGRAWRSAKKKAVAAVANATKTEKAWVPVLEKVARTEGVGDIFDEWRAAVSQKEMAEAKQRAAANEMQRLKDVRDTVKGTRKAQDKEQSMISAATTHREKSIKNADTRRQKIIKSADRQYDKAIRRAKNKAALMVARAASRRRRFGAKPRPRRRKFKFPSCAAKKTDRFLFEQEIVDSQCKPTSKTIQGISDMVKLVPAPLGGENHPEWIMMSDCYDDKGSKWFWKNAGKISKCKGSNAKIRCPCNDANGTKLTPEAAFRQILGQMADMDASSTVNIKPESNKIKFERMKSALATVTMVSCWKSRCAEDEDDGEEDGGAEDQEGRRRRKSSSSQGAGGLVAGRRRRKSSSSSLWGSRRRRSDGLIQADRGSLGGLNAYASIFADLDMGSSSEWGGGVAC